MLEDETTGFVPAGVGRKRQAAQTATRRTDAASTTTGQRR